MEVCRLSVPPMLRLWHELQEMNPDLDSRGSKNNIFPNSTIFSFFGFAAGIGWMGSSAADAPTGTAMVPIDSSDMINARFIIGNLPKNAAVVAQPITPHKFYPLGNCKLEKMCLWRRMAPN